MYLAAAAMLSTGAAAACARDPPVSITVACNRTSSWQGNLSKAAFQLCVKTLRGVPESSTTSGYGIVAAKAALQSCAATQSAAKKLSQDPKLPDLLQATYSICADMYDFARSGIVAMEHAMKTCSVPGLRKGLEGANAAVNDCLQKLRLVEGDDRRLPLHGMVLADRDRIMLAGLLGALIPQ
jgi:hypothetical protein